ncbi:MAG: ABC transporter permease [Chloroflexia bacterium]|nr:ABC transporter permease [Chloroflexia bacterium]
MLSETRAYMIRRVLMLVPLLIGLSFVMFLLLRLAPGDPATAMMSPQAMNNPDYVEQTRRNLGLDEPLYAQYGIWLRNLATGDLGTAYSFNNKPVLNLIGERVMGTLQLQGAALLLGILIAVPVGIISATRQYSLWDNSVTVGSFIGLALPGFWLALLLQVWLGVRLDWFPIISTGQANADWSERWKFFVLPIVVLTLPNIAYFARFMRSSMLEVINQDYVITARAKGLSRRDVLYSHALRNALLPMVTVIGLQLPQIIGGAVIIEQIFAWPGLGLLAFDAISRRDYPVIMGITMVTGAVIMIASVMVDLIYVLLDPRVSVAGPRNA